MPCTAGALSASRTARASGLAGGTGPEPTAAIAIVVPAATAMTNPAREASSLRVEIVRSSFIAFSRGPAWRVPCRVSATHKNQTWTLLGAKLVPAPRRPRTHDHEPQPAG